MLDISTVGSMWGSPQCGARRSSRPSCPPRARSLLLAAGDLGPQEAPRAASAHHRPAGVRARLQSPVRRRGGGRGGKGGPGRLLRTSSVPAGPTAASTSPCSSPRSGWPASSSTKVRARARARAGGGRWAWPAPPGPRLTRPHLPGPGTAALCGLAYLSARLCYFRGYARSERQR